MLFCEEITRPTFRVYDLQAYGDSSMLQIPEALRRMQQKESEIKQAHLLWRSTLRRVHVLSQQSKPQICCPEAARARAPYSS